MNFDLDNFQRHERRRYAQLHSHHITVIKDPGRD